MSIACFSLQLLAAIFAGRLILRHTSGQRREVLFALLNSATTFWFLFFNSSSRHLLFHSGQFVIYFALVTLQYLALRWWAGAKGWRPWLAFAVPIAVLIAVRYIPPEIFWQLAGLTGFKSRPEPNLMALVGISYLAFRCSRLVLEIRNGSVPAPGFWEYLGFAFFLPTMNVGPINTYANYRRGFATDPWEVPLGRAWLRIGVGAVKYQFLGSIFNQLSYSGLLLDDHPHHWPDLPVAMACYYLFLYCNFSGFCDMAIGAAALIGIPVAENFDHPFAARNVKDFWNRWHITLSQYMRDVVFAPLSKTLVRAFGPAHANHAIALTITVVFLLVGIWHGVGWNYLLFGAAHALGVVTNHYYTLALKKRLGRDGFKAYNENPWIHAAAVTLTFAYCAASLLFFANTLPQLRQIFASLQ